MDLFTATAILITLTALFSYVNDRYIHLHASVGVMVISLVLSLVLIGLGEVGFGIKHFAASFLSHIDFDRALLRWMLGFLLFAGALTVDLNELFRQRGITAVLAVFGTVVSMFIVGALLWSAEHVIRLGLSFDDCLLFGALISPTDPVAVVGLMKRMGVSKSVETIVSAESLFNDGIGVVLFLTLLSVAHRDGSVSAASVTWLFVRQSVGGAMLGLAAGTLCYSFLRNVRNHQLEVLLTLALVMGGYALADALYVSGPIAIVVAGLLIGNSGLRFAMAEDTREDLDQFWELIDEILNAILFVLIGLEVLVTPFTLRHLLASIVAIPIVLLARWLSVVATIVVLPNRGGLRQAMIPVLTWGGLRGGLAVAMALSVPSNMHRDALLPITYGVVVFSIIVQGTTIRRVMYRYLRGEAAHAKNPPIVQTPASAGRP